MAKKQFKSESKRLLDLMIHSIYTKKEIFLRELISNASDAIDKLAYQALTDDKVGLKRSDFAIRLTADPAARTLTVSDNGVGMDEAELENNLGTIARSGSRQFVQELTEDGAEKPEIIGRFGVGFYSVFMVASKVTVISKKYGAESAYIWESAGADGYTVKPCDKEQAGTDVILQLKDDADGEDYSQYLREYELRALVKKYSDYIRYPIRMAVTKTREVDDPDAKPEEGKETPKKTESYTEVETLNTMTPIWRQAKSEAGEEAYKEFYKEHFLDYEDPSVAVQTTAEGAASFHALLFVPAKTPYDYYTKEYRKGLELYANGVLIMERCEALLPDHFRFVRGVVDSEDLSLNISRETLQQDHQVQLIRTAIEKRVKTELKKLLENDREKYEKFWSAFGLQLKYGVVSDYGANRELLGELLLFTSAAQGKTVTLDEYVAAMPETQKKIYFVCGESAARIAKLPQSEAVRAAGCDLLLLTDEVDEFVMRTLHNWKEKDFCDILSEETGLEAAEKTEDAPETAAALEFLKQTLGERVSEVRIGRNLGSHAVSMVPGEQGVSFETEKYLSKVNPEMAMKAKRVLEINPAHPAIGALAAAAAADPEKGKKYAELLYEQGLLMAGLPIDDPTAYADLVCSLLL